MDRTDWHILDELQADARLSINELGRRVSLSAPSTGDRVRRLQDSGVVTGYHAHVDPASVGRSVRAFVRMQCYGRRAARPGRRGVAGGADDAPSPVSTAP
jgi:Lrp/AsnC family leucine-responsive transcriptional regulator